MKLAGVPQSGFATLAHDHHRLRRAALNPFFSKRTVTQLEPIIQEKVEKLSSRLEMAFRAGDVIRLDAAYMALTMDVITQYAYSRSFNYLDEDDFKIEWKTTLLGALEKFALNRHFPWLFHVLNAMPDWFVLRANPGMSMMFSWQRGVRTQVKSILEEKGPEEKSPEEKAPIKTIFHTLRDSDLPANEKTLDRLSDEGTVLVAAGSETTGKALTTISYYLMQNPKLMERLKAELNTVLPTPETKVPWATLERQPFLVRLPPRSSSYIIFQAIDLGSRRLYRRVFASRIA